MTIIRTTTIVMILLVVTVLQSGAAINQWRGDEAGADWNDAYKWKLQHPPKDNEQVHFRQHNSMITINSTIELGDGMHLYGEELRLEGHGNINLRSPIPHKRTIYIPASSSGYANLTLTDSLSINGVVSLSAKTYGTAISKGSITLKDRANAAGEVIIGSQGNGTGQITVRDQSTYRITHLNLDTQATKGGSAEIHILGGTVRISVGENPFEPFLADSSRKIIIGDNGKLYIESDLSIAQKQRQLGQLMAQNQIIAATGCKLSQPVIRDDMLMLKAENFNVSSRPGFTAQEMNLQDQNTATEESSTTKSPTSGYIIFLTTLLLFALKPINPENESIADTQ